MKKAYKRIIIESDESDEEKRPPKKQKLYFIIINKLANLSFLSINSPPPPSPPPPSKPSYAAQAVQASVLAIESACDSILIAQSYGNDSNSMYDMLFELFNTAERMLNWAYTIGLVFLLLK